MTHEAPQDLPLSFVQEQLWFLDRLQPGSSLYNIPVALRLSGPLDAEALRLAFGEVMRRHDTLRVRFTDAGGVPRQTLSPDAGIELPLTDLNALDEERREDEARRLVAREAAIPFDLASGPLVRLLLLRLADEDHLLVVTGHHIVLDGASFGILFEELGTAYSALRHGRQPALPKLQMQYADYAREQRDRSYTEQLAFWRRRLADIPPVLQLPGDRPRPAVRSDRGAVERFELDGHLAHRLRMFSQGESTTVPTTLLSAFTTLLGRYCDQQDVVLGTVMYNRPEPEHELLIGYFANTVVLRTDLSGDPTFREVVRNVGETLLEAMDHEDVPFEEVVRAVQPERDASATPLIQVMFGAHHGELLGVPRLDGLTVDTVEVACGTAKFDLGLDVVLEEDRIVCELEYSTDLFDPATVRRMGGHLRRLLEGALGEPDRPIASLDLLTEAEREQILVEWNDTRADGTREHCLHRLFEDQAARTPDDVAVVWQDERLTYRELDERANQVAHTLRARGVGPEVSVGICLERSTATVTALLGVLKAGGGFVALDPDYPGERLAFMLADSRAALLLSESATARALPIGTELPALLLDTDAADIAARPVTPPATGVTPANLACLIYTSGSTGAPKCAALTHGNFTNYFHFFERTYDLSKKLRAHLQTASFAFDLFIADTMRALFTGATLVLCPREVALTPSLLYDLMVREGVNSAEFIPPLLRVLLDHVEESGQTLRFVDILMAGGDSWYVRDFERAKRLCSPDTLLIDTYGLTEAAIDNAHFVGEEAGDSPDSVVPIGRPIGNTQLYILNRAMQPMPVGVPGELYIGGAGVGRGYFGRPALTADRYVPDPFSGVPGSRLYRTGDLTRYRPDGTIEILGRADHQVKVRGYRIELGEIEEALRQHPVVEDALVLLHEKTLGDRHLVAYVSAAPGQWPADEDTRPEWQREVLARLKEQLRGRLPAYMVPSAVILLERMPLNSNGKLDRRALPSPVLELAQLGGGDAAPRTPVEEIVAGVWCDVIGVAAVGAHDNFFSLGGHSLLATRVLARLRDALGTELPVRAIYESPTVAALAERIETHRQGAAPRTPSIVPSPRLSGQPFPLSFAQQRLWFIDQLEPDSAAYHVPTPMRLHGPLDTEALRLSFQAVAERHEVLRTVFTTVDGVPQQVVRPTRPWELPLTDLTALPPEERRREAEQLVRDDAARPFDLAHGPLLRTALLRVAPQEHILLLTMHHIVTDGWSGSIFFEDLAALYAAHRRHETADLPELPLRYADFAEWQRERLHGKALEEHLGFWRRRLADAPRTIDLPVDRPRSSARGSAGGEVTFVLPAELLARLKALSRAEDTTLFMTLLAAFQALLARLTGQDDIVVATPTAGRDHTELERLVGFFVNTLAMRTDLSGDPAFHTLLERVRHVALDAYVHGELPFEKIVEELSPDRTVGHNPLAQVLFVLQNSPPETVELAGLTVEPEPCENAAAQFDLSMSLTETPTGLEGVLSYRTELFDPGTAERIADQWSVLLRGVADRPGTRISELPLTEGTTTPSPAATRRAAPPPPRRHCPRSSTRRPRALPIGPR
ncbi:hypothetical protein SSPO_000270 [Streptomyces antimycoticus]|uniref:Carrier domain-containing protein n=1 Tax=Streptomyces antimycoticus TaxID=68175 RepID=A0A499UJT0_9ACTN|nr:non-ribosomal peptide synthetase [Streptomyces antimycoticus]BBJ37309.1 hypothetical protein SSPO_000270 [Streptomyces antimycoticus]